MDVENPRPSQKTEGPPATGTRDRVPMLMDPRHDCREGAQLRPGIANSIYTKCTQRLDRAYISNRWRCYHFMVAAPPGDVEIEEESPPSNKTRPKTGGDLEQTHRIETPSKDGPTTATKTSTSSLPRTNVP